MIDSSTSKCTFLSLSSKLAWSKLGVFARKSTSLALIYSLSFLALATGATAQRKKVSPAPRPVSEQKAENAPPQSSDGNKISDSAARQIKALDDEKDSRTPAQQKIDSQLIYATKQYRGEEIAPGGPTLEVEVGLESDGRVVVDITTIVDDQVLGVIKQNGGEIILVAKLYQSIRARVSIVQLETIAALPQVRFIQPKQGSRNSQRVQRPTLPAREGELSAGFALRANEIREQLLGELASSVVLPDGTLSVGSVASEGDTTHRASTARGVFNVDGTGIKIGVISDGVTSLTAAQTTGDVGLVTVLPGQEGTGDEGTAMLEIVHDIAPGAQLYFATADPTITQFAQNIRDLRTAGCDIIVDDVGYFVESPFQDGAPGVTNTNGGVVTQAVNDVVAGGALYFSSAANSGNKNDGTSTTWEGDFVSGGTLAVVPGGGLVHDFDPTAAVAQFDLITVGGGTGVPINLSWSDPLGASNNDYDLFILNNAGTAVSVSSTNIQSGTQDPYEQVSTNNTTNRRVVIRQKAGAANRFLHLGMNGGRINFNTGGETHGHAAASGGYGVAATPAFAAFNFPPLATFGPYPNLFSTANSVETFSSDGPRRIFFQGNGTAITPGDFSSTGGQVLQQPVITAADGNSVTGAGDFPTPFFGTSAAAPHAAAIAALIKSANPAFTQAQIRTALTTTALDIETAGTDRDAGFGVIMPYAALQSLGVSGKALLELGSVSAVETGINNNGLIERGEVGTLFITLNNAGVLNATGITSVLTTSTPGVTVQSGSASYADMAATSGTGANTTPIYFTLSTSSAVDVVANFTLTVSYAGGWNASQVINFAVATGRKPITTILDTTVSPTNISFPVTATGTQTNLVFPDDPSSTCGAPTAFPGTLTSTTPRFDSYTITNAEPIAACVTITITADKSALGAIQAVAYSNSFNPASLGTNYLADPGFASIVSPGYAGVFTATVPASGTLIVVVAELKSPGNGFPSALGSTYTLKVAGLPVSLAPTEATASVSGVVSANGSGVAGAIVTMTPTTGQTRFVRTNSFGYFRFDEVDTGGLYVFQVSHKRFAFEPQVITVNGELTGLIFAAL
jgi:hypothetical protein